MRIAFLISAHNDVQHLKRLIEALPHKAEFFVHIDAETDIKPFTEAIDNPNVHFVERRYNIMWGSFMQVRYQMELALSLQGFKKKLMSFDFVHAMEDSGIDTKVAERIIRRFPKFKQKWFECIDASFITPEQKGKYKSLINERLTTLTL